ncbi:MAG TPA: UDP-N-acetylmuramoyl-L-alanyl-D-glutamate--2,6-diaminopimelate ligase [Gaiellaceae bacterium]|nr:UDP-N-acetylmuramoyl-L-alanyl-D-glutamate--2,6-diaminopimelate ligase [Gaiellaceae bacterium]
MRVTTAVATGPDGRLGPIELDALREAIRPARTVNAAAVDIADLAYDARRVASGSLFFCVPGFKADGHEFAPEAVARGAAALVVARPLDLAVPQLVVPDVREAMALAADRFFGRPTRDLQVVGVTGTNGKTTTAFLVYSILAAAGRRPGLLGTVECRIGGERRPVARTTPEAIDLQRTLHEMLAAGDRSCALEATSHASELRRLVGVRFAALVFTNLSQDHLDFHGTLERYFDAKRRLFVEPDVDGRLPPAAVNVGDPYGRRLGQELATLGAPFVTFALEGDADVRADELELTPAGARFAAAGIRLETRLRGRFNVENVLGAVAAARLLGVEDGAIAAGVASLTGVPGRFEAVDEGQPFTVLVDYAHTPEALANVLVAARRITRGRLVCVFGCGGDRDRGKRPLMGELATRLADRAVVTSDNPRSEDPDEIIAEIVGGTHGDVTVERDRAAAIRLALEGAEDGDVVVIAGKGHEQGQEFADRTIPFDDREVAREALRRLATGAAA